MDTDLVIRLTTLHSEVELINTNLNLFITNVRDELHVMKADQRLTEQKSVQNAESIANIDQILIGRMESLFQIYKGKLEQESLNQYQKQQELYGSQIIQIDDIQAKLNDYESQMSNLLKKLELKSTDKYIANLVQHSLLNDQELAQFILDKTITVSKELIQEQLNQFTTHIEERVDTQFQQLINFQTQFRKQAQSLEELESSLGITRQAVIDHQKSQNKKIGFQINMMNQFKDDIKLQTETMFHQGEDISNTFKLMQNDFQAIKITIENFERKNDKEHVFLQQYFKQLQQQLNEQGQKVKGEASNVFKVEFENVKQIIDNKLNVLEQDVQTLKSHKTIISSESRQQQQQKVQFSNVQLQQRAFLKQKQLLNQQQKLPLKDQVVQIELLFHNVETLFKHIQRKLKAPEDYRGNDSPQMGGREILIQENPVRIISNQHRSLNDEFDDSKLYQKQVARPLFIIGKQQNLDIRPQAEISNLQSRIRQMSVMLQDQELEVQPTITHRASSRDNSANKLPSLWNHGQNVHLNQSLDNYLLQQ